MESVRQWSIIQIQTPEEYEISLKIRHEVFIEEQGVPKEIEIDPFENSGENFLLFYQDDPVGVGRYKIKQGLAKFERVAILKSVRGRGLGRILMEALESDAANRFPGYLQAMQAQYSAIPFYEKLGWVQIGEIFHEAGIVHRWMVKPPKDPKSLVCLHDPAVPTVILKYLKGRKT
ncbi:MAG: putative N-acetyltransferase YjcF [Chlamydiae bacterium]|nr:putative N-acetyltransferase YjcF [Chlamydiota bacterium]